MRFSMPCRFQKAFFITYFGSKERFCAEAIEHYINPFIKQWTHICPSLGGETLGSLETYFNKSIAELEKTEYKGSCYQDLLQSGLAMAQQQGAIRTD